MIKKIRAFINKVIEEYMVESLCKNVKYLIESTTTSHVTFDYYKSTQVYHISFENKIRCGVKTIFIRKNINIVDHDLPFINDIEILKLVDNLIGKEGEFENESST